MSPPAGGHRADGDIAVYFNDSGEVAHAGLVRGDLIRSKWGGIGHVWDYSTFEVPIGYGNRVQRFEPLPLREVLEACANCRGGRARSQARRRRPTSSVGMRSLRWMGSES